VASWAASQGSRVPRFDSLPSTAGEGNPFTREGVAEGVKGARDGFLQLRSAFRDSGRLPEGRACLPGTPKAPPRFRGPRAASGRRAETLRAPRIFRRVRDVSGGLPATPRASGSFRRVFPRFRAAGRRFGWPSQRSASRPELSGGPPNVLAAARKFCWPVLTSGDRRKVLAAVVTFRVPRELSRSRRNFTAAVLTFRESRQLSPSRQET
jgi:hypothetical protein